METVDQYDVNGHDIRVTRATTKHSALFECVTCKTGFVKRAVMGPYTSPNPCPELALIWELIETERRERDGQVQE